MQKLILSIITFCLTGSLSAQQKFSSNDYIRALKSATDVMVNDATSPVAASRYYAYITLAANETITLFEKQQPSFAGFAKALQPISISDTLVTQTDESLAAIVSVYRSAIRLLPSGYLLQKNIDSLRTVAQKKKISAKNITASFTLADRVVEQVLKYAVSDGFTKLSGYRRFTPAAGDAYWQPTAPGFISAIEPYWKTLRTFFLDSCSQFTGSLPSKYSSDTSSEFYKGLKEVYDICKNLTKQQTEIALFWDCNPFALQQVGHLEYAIKKISPGGHWIGITGIACQKQKSSLARTVYVHALVSVGIADAFIACWFDKYRDNRVRPVTAIKKLIDQSWSPLLQTPPFPEYTSGHSVISTTAATILTHFFGDHFSFVDHTEVEFGLTVRQFDSFIGAAKEAAISRLYGGIHFRDAIDNGVREGQEIGQFVIAHGPDSAAGAGKN